MALTVPDQNKQIIRTNHLLIIGIDQYHHHPPLNNARRDAETFRDILVERYQFEKKHVTELLDEKATRKNILRTIKEKSESLTDKDNLLIYFSGHGTMNSRKTQGFWVPIEAEADEVDFVANDRVRAYIRDMQAHHVYLMVDACFSGSMIVKSSEKLVELLEENPSRRVLTSGRKEYVSDGPVGGHSPFFTVVKHYLNQQPNAFLSCLELENYVVHNTPRNAHQLPEANFIFGAGDQSGKFVFYPKEIGPKRTHETPDILRFPRAKDYKKIIGELREEQFVSAYTQAIYDAYIELKLDIHIEALTAQIQRYWDGEKDNQAKERLREWEKTSKGAFIRRYGAYGPLVPSTSKAKPQVKEERKISSSQPTFDFPLPEMVFVKGGRLMMGGNVYSDEKSIHEVNLPDFYVGKYQVTQEEWKAIMGTNPSHFNGDNHPVEQISWFDVQAYIQKLNEKTGLKFHLPSEVQWEYAARGGQQSQGFKYAGGNELNEVAWWDKNANGKPHPVGQKKPNELGLYDMSGNAWEWCQDHWHDSYEVAPDDSNSVENGDDETRVVRGGSWIDYSASFFRLSFRIDIPPDYRDYLIGFRLCRYIS